MPVRLPWQKKEGSEEIEITLPDEVQKKLDGAASKEDVNNLKTTLEKLQESMATMSANSNAEAEERRKRSERAAKEAADANRVQSDEELTELALTDPVAAMRRITAETLKGRDAALMTINAANLRREVFENADKYPLYTDKIKDEVDKLLATQDLKSQNDRTTIEHAYYSVVGQHVQEITDGKLKSRFASSEGSRGTHGTIPDGKDDKKGPRTMSEDEKRVASILGFDEKAYGEMLDKEGVGYV